MRTEQPAEPTAATDWTKVSVARGSTTPTRPIDPAVNRALSAADARILREDEIDELRRLRDECVEWLAMTPHQLRSTDKKLARAIRRARRFATNL